jgi:hypothetical protein
MTRRLRYGGGHGGRLALVIITIFAMAGTLSSCGRYGSPVRSVSVAETIAPSENESENEEDASVEKGVLDEPSNWTAEPIESEESEEFEEFEE